MTDIPDNPLWRSLWGPDYKAPKPTYAKNDTSAATARLAGIREKEKLRVPKKLVTAPETLAERWDTSRYDRRHEPLPMGEPGPWRSAAAGWQQIGDFNPSGRECSSRDCRPKVERKKPFSRRNDPIPEFIKFRADDANELRGAISATALAVAMVKGCRFPMGEPADKNFHFCNAKRWRGSYCAEHHAKALYKADRRLRSLCIGRELV